MCVAQYGVATQGNKQRATGSSPMVFRVNSVKDRSPNGVQCCRRRSQKSVLVVETSYDVDHVE